MADQQPQTPVSPQPAGITADNQEKLFAAIGYFAFLFVIPLVVKPKSQYCQMHAKQSMVMFLISIVVLVILAAVPFIGSLFTLALFALYVVAIYRAYRGDSWHIPVIAAFADKMNLNMFYGSVGTLTSGMGDLKNKVSEISNKAESAVKQAGAQEEKKQ